MNVIRGEENCICANSIYIQRRQIRSFSEVLNIWLFVSLHTYQTLEKNQIKLFVKHHFTVLPYLLCL